MVADAEPGCATTFARSCGFARIDQWFVGATPRESVLQVEVDCRWASVEMEASGRNAFNIVEPSFLTDPKDSGLHGSDK